MTDEFTPADESPPADPVLRHDPAPDHGADFWPDLDRSMNDATTEIRVTEQLPVTPLERQPVEPAAGHVDTPSSQTDSARRMWPLMAAAALVALVGIGVFAFRPGDEPAQVTTDVASAGEGEGETPAIDGELADGADDPESVPATPPANEGDGTDVTSQPTTVPAVTATPRTFEVALGATPGEPILPIDGNLPDEAIFLGTRQATQTSWYTVVDAELPCTAMRHSEILVVNQSGITQTVRDPQLAFSGHVTHLTIDGTNNRAAWLVSCGTQLELYVATIIDGGTFADQQLVWFGEGVVDGALLLWDRGSLSFGAVAPGGDPYFIDVDPEAQQVIGTGAIDLTGAPEGLRRFPLAATPDGRYSYWATTVNNAVSACDGEAYGLWLRDAQNRWTSALADETIGLLEVSALALEPEFSQIAFADACGKADGRLFIGIQRADGLLTGLEEVDLSPFVPGYAKDLIWAEDSTLRVETDNQVFGFGIKRFDYQFNQGRDQGILLQLD